MAARITFSSSPSGEYDALQGVARTLSAIASKRAHGRHPAYSPNPAHSAASRASGFRATPLSIAALATAGETREISRGSKALGMM
jgi:hypothetical protein